MSDGQDLSGKDIPTFPCTKEGIKENITGKEYGKLRR